MKKILLSLGALLVFGIARAQTEPKPPVVPDTKKPARTTTDVVEKYKKDNTIKPDVVNRQTPQGDDGVQPRKDELVTQDHIKSTPKPQTVKKATATKKIRKNATKKKA